MVIDAAGRRSRPVRRLAGPALIGAALVSLFLFTWRGSTDELIDFGRELYLAWRITEGDHLYSDLRYEYGPLSPYVNALVYRPARHFQASGRCM